MTMRRRLSGDTLSTVLLFLIPAFALYAVFLVVPVFQSFRYSLFRWDGLSPLDRFVGLGNYKELLGDPVFWKSLANNSILLVFSLITQLPVAILLAVLLTDKVRMKGLFRTMFFAPQIISTVAAGYMFYYIYEPTFGILNQLLRALNLGSLAKGWLGDTNLALYAVLFVISWRFVGFYMVLFMASIEGMPVEIFEAATMDGCGKWMIVRKITLPMLRDTIKTACVLSIVGSIKYFDLIWVMTQGGPAHASELIATYMYKKTFLSWDVGYGSALAFTLFAIAFVLSSVFMKSTKSESGGKSMRKGRAR
ncbi:MAG: sugar ABC transporter permease [Rectinemataceae bacterium]